MRTQKLALLDAVLLFPAAFFLSSVVLHVLHLWPGGLGHFASQVVAWYAARQWTLWLLLLALPLIVFGIGCTELLVGHAAAKRNTLADQTSAQSLGTNQGPHRSIRYFLGATTATAGVILTIVVLHMLAN